MPVFKSNRGMDQEPGRKILRLPYQTFYFFGQKILSKSFPKILIKSF